MDPLPSIVDRVVDEVSDVSTSRVEDQTRRIVQRHDYIQNGRLEDHLECQRWVSEELPIDFSPCGRNDDPQRIQDKTRRAVSEWVKREALHELRRRQV